MTQSNKSKCYKMQAHRDMPFLNDAHAPKKLADTFCCCDPGNAPVNPSIHVFEEAWKDCSCSLHIAVTGELPSFGACRASGA